jgi:hypothetical protein
VHHQVVAELLVTGLLEPVPDLFHVVHERPALSSSASARAGSSR